MMPKYYSPDGNIEVWEEKPQGYYTVEEWEEMHPAPPPPEPTTEEKITELDRQYNSDKAILMSQYTEAVIDDDSELMASIKEEIAVLREEYDKAYEDIIGGTE
jgi:hypothetical protein